MAISKWIGGILILVAFIVAGRAQADNESVTADSYQNIHITSQ